MSSTSLYFLSRDLTKKIFEPYFDRLDNTYTGFARLTGYSIRLFNCSFKMSTPAQLYKFFIYFFFLHITSIDYIFILCYFVLCEIV